MATIMRSGPPEHRSIQDCENYKKGSHHTNRGRIFSNPAPTVDKESNVNMIAEIYN